MHTDDTSRFQRLLKGWHDLTSAQQWSVIGTLAATIITIVLVWAGPVNQWSYVAFVLATVVALLIDRIARFEFENRASRTLQDSLPGKFDLRYIGGTPAGVAWFAENRSGVRKVRNTVYRPDHGPWTGEPAGYARFEQQIKETMNGAVEWHDLIVAGAREQLDDFYSRLDPREKKQYYARYLESHDLPIMQMIVVTYGDGRSAVCLGWAYLGSSDACVFVSTAPVTVNYFRDYFDALYAKSTELYGPKPRPGGSRSI